MFLTRGCSGAGGCPGGVPRAGSTGEPGVWVLSQGQRRACHCGRVLQRGEVLGTSVPEHPSPSSRREQPAPEGAHPALRSCTRSSNKAQRDTEGFSRKEAKGEIQSLSEQMKNPTEVQQAGKAALTR